MPGTYTHWMIAEASLEAYERLPSPNPLFATIQARPWFVDQGAIGPDYPYIAEALGQIMGVKSWADRMHWESTGEFVACAIQALASRKGEERDICLAWLIGYASHLVADAFVHPVVNLAVGGLPPFKGTPHRECEMVQDSWIYRKLTNREIRNDDYAQRLKLCSDPTDDDRIHPALAAFWKEALEAAHPTAKDDFKGIQPDKWHAWITWALTEATNPIPIFRHIGEALKYVYPRTDQITDQQLKTYVTEVALPKKGPNGEFMKGNFKVDVFDVVVKKVVKVWDQLLTEVATELPPAPPPVHLAGLPNWDLDRGVDLDQLPLW